MSYMKLAKLWYPLHLVQTELCEEQAYGTLTCSIKKNIKKQIFFFPPESHNLSSSWPLE